MRDIDELARHVAAHPEEYADRWTLTKRLYMDAQYGSALPHLKILKSEWDRKLNVSRYLAATYYRLGQYDDAIRELEEAVQYWPSEAAIREQLARVFEVSRRREEAASVWEEVLRLDPRHPLAAQAIRRLRGAPKNTPDADLHLDESDSGIDLAGRRNCPNCGAQNSVDFDRCWQCHALLARKGMATPLPTPVPRERAEGSGPSWAWTLACGLLIVAFLSFGLYLALAYVMERGTEERVAATVYEALVSELIVTRTATACVLLLGWPLALWIALFVTRSPRPPAVHVNAAGLLLATATNVAFWVPLHYATYALVAPVALSLILISGMFRLGGPRTLAVWGIQAALAVGMTLGSFALFEGAALISEFPAIIRYARTQERAASGGLVIEFEALPGESPVAWDSTGSPWLDAAAGSVCIDVTGDTANPPYSVELRAGDEPVFSDVIASVPFRTLCSIEQGREYVLRVAGPEGVSATVSLSGILPLRRSNSPETVP